MGSRTYACGCLASWRDWPTSKEATTRVILLVLSRSLVSSTRAVAPVPLRDLRTPSLRLVLSLSPSLRAPRLSRPEPTAWRYRPKKPSKLLSCPARQRCATRCSGTRPRPRPLALPPEIPSPSRSSPILHPPAPTHPRLVLLPLPLPHPAASPRLCYPRANSEPLSTCNSSLPLRNHSPFVKLKRTQTEKQEIYGTSYNASWW